MILVCWSCQKQHTVTDAAPPRFAIELIAIANSAGLRGAIDWPHGRTLVFCDAECEESQRTKRGDFRLRPKRTPTPPTSEGEK